MTEARPQLSEDTMKLGLLMESAEVQQKFAESHLQRLAAHTQDLDAVVRDEIRRTLVDELRGLTVEVDRVAGALRRVQRCATLRGLVLQVVAAVCCAALPWLAARWCLPSPGAIEALRLERDALRQNIAGLERRGGRVQWHLCGEASRLCVRVDRQSPVFGQGGDYLVVKTP